IPRLKWARGFGTRAASPRARRSRAWSRPDTNTLHTARYQAKYSVVVYYPLHPLRGEQLEVVGEREGPERVLIVRLADGLPFYLPAWMTQPDAAQLEIRTPPRLSIAALGDLQRVLKSILS